MPATPLIQGFRPGYERNGIYSVEFVLARLGMFDANFDGDIIAIESVRYQVFARSRVCVRCGLEGTYFAKERHAKRKVKNGVVIHKATTSTWHLNLYAILPDGREILMTKDHIIPRSKGGDNSLCNLQTMCSPCNVHKADDFGFQALLPFGSNAIML